MNPQPLTDQQKITITAGILKTGKTLAADRFPKPNPETTTTWAAALDYMFAKYPFPDLWREAILHWATEMVTEDMVTPRDIKEAAEAVMDRWRRDPKQGPMLEKWSEQRRENRIQRLLGNGEGAA